MAAFFWMLVVVTAICGSANCYVLKDSTHHDQEENQPQTDAFPHSEENYVIWQQAKNADSDDNANPPPEDEDENKENNDDEEKVEHEDTKTDEGNTANLTSTQSSLTVSKEDTEEDEMNNEIEDS